MARFRLPWSVLLAMLAIGCATRPSTYVIAPGHEGAPGVARVLLVPLAADPHGGSTREQACALLAGGGLQGPQRGP